MFNQLCSMETAPIVMPAIEQAKLVASDGEAGERFGQACALSNDGDTLVVGSENDDDGGSGSGAIYIFVRDPSSREWSQQAKLFITDTNLELGTDVSISDDGNTVAAGHNGSNNTVYVWKRVGVTWSPLTIPTPSTTGGDFGVSVSLSADGDVLAVGAPEQTVSGNARAGAVFIYTRSGDTWTEDDRLTQSSPAENDYMGTQVRLSGNGSYCLAAAGLEPAASYMGVVFFDNSGWSQQQVLGAGINPQRPAIAIDDTGAYAFIHDGAWNSPITEAGRILVYKRTGTSWVSIYNAQRADNLYTENAQHFISVSRDGSVLATPNRDSGDINYRTALFRRNGADEWPSLGVVRGEEQVDDDQAGVPALSGDGKTLAVGAKLHDVGANSNQGAVWIFTSSDNLG